MAAHRDADVYRFAIMHLVARKMMAAKPGQPTVQQHGRVQTRTVSARDGIEAMRALAKKRSS